MVFRPSQPLNFKNNKYLLYEATDEHQSIKKNYRFMIGLDCFLIFMTLRSIYKFRLIRSILWGIPTIIISKMTKGLAVHCAHVITKIELNDNGT
jgi:hypothetical protein